MKKIMITRPLAQAEKMAREIRGLNFETIIVPVLNVEALPFDIPENSESQILLFTSSNAVEIFAKALVPDSSFFSKPVFCVGDKTAEIARENNFKNVKSANGNSEHLCAMIRDHHQSHFSYLHIRGHHVAQPLHVWLAQHNINVDILHVYKTRKIEQWPSDVIEAFHDDDIQAVIHMSPRSAEAYVALVQRHGLEGRQGDIKSLSISPAVLKCVQSLNWRKSCAAEQPNKASLYDLIQAECLPLKR